MKNSEDSDLSIQSIRSRYIIEVSEILYRKIDKVIRTLNQFEKKNSKQSWILEAIKEKLQSEEDLQKEDISRSKLLTINIDSHLKKKIEEKVSLLKQFNTSYSKKKWLLDAIFAKLEREEYKAEKLIESLKTKVSISKDHKP